MPNPAQIASNVLIEGKVFRLKILARVNLMISVMIAGAFKLEPGFETHIFRYTLFKYS